MPQKEKRQARRTRQRKEYHRFMCALWVILLVSGILVGALLLLRGRSGISPMGGKAIGRRILDSQREEPEQQPPAVQESWMLYLANKDHPIPDGYVPPVLTQLRGGHRVDSRIYPQLQQMMDDARAAGCDPVICSSYRSHSKQVSLFENKIDRLVSDGYSRDEAAAEAANWVAVPGTSEHEMGLALDIVDANYQELEEDQEDTPTQRWLLKHSWEYGFVLRYPEDKVSVTGVGYEPWHYRYVGREAAEQMYRQGICLEEYLQN